MNKTRINKNENGRWEIRLVQITKQHKNGTVIFFRGSLLGLYDAAADASLVQHFVAGMNPTTVALNAHFKHSAFHLSCWKE